MKFKIPNEELMSSGVLSCPGCGGTLAMRLALKALGKKTYIVLPACCWSIIDGPFPYSATSVPLMHTAFETGGSASAGVRAALDIQGKKDIQVLAWAGDGGTLDIGMQALSGAAERNDNFIYACYDNEAYMNTGIQRSSATPWGAWSSTTPRGKEEPKKNMMAIMAAHGIPYAATASVAYPDDLIRKFTKAKKIYGTKYIHIFAPCPPGWKALPEQTIKFARMAVENGIFPLYEIEHGEKYTLNYPNPEQPLLSIKEYFKLQGRFRHLSDKDIQLIQEKVRRNWTSLLRKTECY